ncbi:MAG: Stp1/IreP family PP2C-type Ser/Thr phosphatase [Parachlamydia sp.]|nr:Stp1/IreP family PP2C-type Ser/Thr phosphatase [Parachlamydia sp.]
MPKVLATGLSDIGLVRENNEDVWAEVPQKRFYILADGMGGHLAGEVAAREAVDELIALINDDLGSQMEQVGLEEARHLLAAAIGEVNIHVYRMGRKDPALRGMGTTLCCLYFHPQGVIYAHVGDSRIYRMHENQLTQVSKDHSLLRELVDLGELTERQAEEHAYKNIITKAIGTEPSVDPAVQSCDTVDGDLYMMCTDGLSDLLSRKEMEEILLAASSLKKAANELVAVAKEKGGYDNITVVIAKVNEKPRKKHLPGQ